MFTSPFDSSAKASADVAAACRMGAISRLIDHLQSGFRLNEGADNGERATFDRDLLISLREATSVITKAACRALERGLPDVQSRVRAVLFSPEQNHHADHLHQILGDEQRDQLAAAYLRGILRAKGEAKGSLSITEVEKLFSIISNTPNTEGPPKIVAAPVTTKLVLTTAFSFARDPENHRAFLELLAQHCTKLIGEPQSFFYQALSAAVEESYTRFRLFLPNARSGEYTNRQLTLKLAAYMAMNADTELQKSIFKHLIKDADLEVSLYAMKCYNACLAESEVDARQDLADEHAAVRARINEDYNAAAAEFLSRVR